MDFRMLLSIMCVYTHNMKVIHWNSAGKQFDRIHVKITDDYYNMIAGDQDAIAEMMGMLDIAPVGYLEAYEILKKSDNDYVMLEGGQEFEYESAIKAIDVMLSDIVDALEKILETDEVEDDPGIRSTLETLHFNYSKELKFFNKRRR